MSNQLNGILGELVAAGGGTIHTGPFGSQLHAADYVSQGIPCVMPANMKDNRVDLSGIAFIGEKDASRLSKYIVKKDDILYSRRGDVTKKALIRDKEAGYFCGTGCLLLRPGNNFDARYLTYYLSLPKIQNWIVSQAVGATMPNLNTGILSSIPFHGPDKQKQKQIADVLSVIEEKIELNNSINSKLEIMATTLYNYWFVQFDFPNTKGKPYKTSRGKMVYNSALKRDIPEGWQHSTIGDTFKTHLGGTPSRNREDYWFPEEINWLSSGENPDTFVMNPNEKISKTGLANSPAKLLPKGTVILSIVRHLRASILGIEAATNQSVVGILETERLKHCFIYPYILGEIPRLMALRTGAQQPHINKGVLDDSPLVIPDEKTLHAYTNLTAPMFLQMNILYEENQRLTQLRDWLLPMLMNGQVTMK